jgi:DNA-binding NarL/FixJ family response regulator
VIADDHAILRMGIRKMIEESKHLAVIGEAGDGLALLDLLKEITPDLIILDISMPNIRGIEAASEIKETHPEIKILILTMHKRKEYMYYALSAGVEGYMLKEETDQELLLAIETIRKGGVYLSPHLSKEFTKEFVRIRSGKPGAPQELLTVREREILKLISEGKINKEIADLLFISVRTVHHHRANLMEKLDLRNVADLVRYAVRQGYTS